VLQYGLLERQKKINVTGITMSEKMKKILLREMQNLDAAGLLRTETASVETDEMKVDFKGNKNYLNFIGNDILGWSTNDNVYEAAAEALSKYGVGSTSPRNSIGTLDIVKKLEDKLASFLGLDDCIVFPSNYLANVGLFEPLTSKTDTVFIDEMCNPSLFDGLRLSSANVITYKHEDYEGLEYELKCAQNSRFRIIVTDAVFNADGCHTDLKLIQKLKDVYDAITIVDDSFGIGVLGENGKGTFSHLQLEKNPDLMTGTFAHALGNISGGFVAGNKDLINWIRHTSRSYILSEPLSPINSAIVLQVIDILQQGQFNSNSDAGNPDLDEDQSVLEKLYSNSNYIKSEMLHNNWRVKRNNYPFISINVGSTLNAQKMVEALFEKKILVSALCYPNTPEDASLLRINLSANHTKKQLNKLTKSLTEAFEIIK
jgi:7-keto-8-aminopelargonate synthetase-like enzyme